MRSSWRNGVGLIVATKKSMAKMQNFASPLIDLGVRTFRTWVVDFDNLEEDEEPNPGAQYSVEEVREIRQCAAGGRLESR